MKMLEKGYDFLDSKGYQQYETCDALLDVGRVWEFSEPKDPETIGCPCCGGRNYVVVVSNPSGKKLWFCLEMKCLMKMKSNRNINWS